VSDVDHRSAATTHPADVPFGLSDHSTLVDPSERFTSAASESAH
jgi:hypothetical protein